MSRSAADRVTIDLRGIGDAVRSTAAGRGLTIAAFAREALVNALSGAPATRELPDAPSPRLHGTVKLTWRMDVRAAVALACRVRLRPVLMTSLATIIGLMPMALKLGAGSEAYAPLARAIATLVGAQEIPPPPFAGHNRQEA